MPRTYAYDLLRAIAIIMVMVDHARCVDLSQTANDSLCALMGPDAVLFFMLSGALLLPGRAEQEGFLRRRLMRVLPPTIFWSCVVGVTLYLQGRVTGAWAWHIVKYSWLIPAVDTYWFIFIIISLYLFMPVVAPWLERASKRQLEFYLALWLIGGLGPWLVLVTFNYDLQSNMFYMFTTYMSYCIAGVYLSRYPLDFSRPARTWGFIAAGLILGVAFPLWVCFHPGNQTDVASLVGNNLSFTTELWGCLIFALCLKVKTLGRIGDFIVRLYSRNAFGIYLIQGPLVLLVIVPYFPELKQSTPLMLGVLLTVPLILSELTRRIPIIGSRN